MLAAFFCVVLLGVAGSAFIALIILTFMIQFREEPEDNKN